MLLRLSGEGHLYHQVYAALRRAILAAELPAGSRLPSTRTLADELGVSRNTVVQAYEQLGAEGYVTGQTGSGTYVSQSLREHVFPDPEPAAPVAGELDSHEPSLSAGCRRAMEGAWRWAPEREAPEIDFRYGRPPYRDLPFETMRRLIARRVRLQDRGVLDYVAPEGPLELRETLADYLRRARGVRATSDRIVLLNGSQQALDVAARMLLDPGDRVALEELHYTGARLAFEAAGAECVPVSLDEDGVRRAASSTWGRSRRCASRPFEWDSRCCRGRWSGRSAR